MKSRTGLLHRNRDASQGYRAYASAHRQVADLLLALDRILVEVSMDMYNLKKHDRRKMRAHHGRVHAALREHLSRLRRRAGTEA